MRLPRPTGGGGGGGGASAFGPSNVLNVLLFGLVVVETFLVSHYRTMYMHSKYFEAPTVAGDGSGAGARPALLQQQGTHSTGSIGAGGSAATVQHLQAAAAATGDVAGAVVAAAAAQRAAAQGAQGGAASASAGGGSGAAGSVANDRDREGLRFLITNDQYRRRLDAWERMPNGTEYKSSKFAPLRISECTHRMPKHWAPCLVKHMHGVDAEYAEEVVYPTHRVRLPGFLNKDDRQRWLTVVNSRALVPKEDQSWIGFHVQGQNFILRNVRYTNNPFPDNWNSDDTHCLGCKGEVAHLRSTKPQAGDRQHEEILIANTPQSFSFQHFSDHVFKIIIQSMHLASNQTEVIAGIPEGSSVREIWHWFQPIQFDKIIFGKAPAHFAKRLIHSCRTPFWHPYMVQRWQEMALGPDAPFVPMRDRKVVLYYTRSAPDQRIHNGGRKVLNEKELLVGITDLLKRRNQGETLRVLNLNDFPTYKEVATFMNRNVRAFIGPHGGGLINCLWLAMNTLVVEFQHHMHVNYAMWELSPLLEQNYWVLTYPPVAGTDMNVNIQDVLALLEQELGAEHPAGTYVDYDYDWPKALTESGGWRPTQP